VRLALLALLAAACGDDPRPPLAASLKVMTINIRHDSDEPERRLPLIADEIVRLEPDVIGLQEIEIAVEQSATLLGLIADRGGPTYQVYEHLKWDAGVVTGEGIGIFSRLPILEMDVKDLQEGFRIAVWTRVQVEPGYALDLYNTHLEANGEDLNRLLQARLAMEFMEETGEDGPKFLTGDMNATPDSMTIMAYGSEGGLTDSFLAVHGAQTETIGNTSPIVLMEGAVQNPVRRIDYIFARGATPTDSIVCFENADAAGFYPSDHLGVMTTFATEIP
jgi:endonuclease/exonuclease/phosphatase family metal-dependent hydrolase